MKDSISSEKKAGFLTLAFNVIFFLVLFFMIAWKETIPPIPEYGIELGLNDIIDNSDEDNENQINENESNDSKESLETKNELDDEEVKEESKESNENIFDKENIDKNEVKDFNDLPIDKKETTPKNLKKNIEINLDKKNTDDELSTKEVIDSRSIYTEESNSTSGASLDLQGWLWDSLPKPEDSSIENGKIVFEIFVDIYGEIMNIKTIETTVNPSIEKIYKDEVLNLTFSPTSSNYNPADISKGTITFIIKSK